MVNGTNSATNFVMGISKQPDPKVGMGCTILFYTDRHAATIVEVSDDGKSVVIQEDIATRTDKNGLSESQTYEYAPNPTAKKVTYSLRKNGAWVRKGSPMKNGQRISIGHRSHYYDPCF